MSIGDPKILIALLSWALYSFAVLARPAIGWTGRRAAWLSAIGFAIVLLNFFLLLPLVIVAHYVSQLAGQWHTWTPSTQPVEVFLSLSPMPFPLAVWRARRHDVRSHRQAMIWIFALALVVTGLFTLAPGRIMSKVVFGG